MEWSEKDNKNAKWVSNEQKNALRKWMKLSSLKVANNTDFSVIDAFLGEKLIGHGTQWILMV